MVAHEIGTPLQEWANAHVPDDQLVYRDGFWDQITFVRDVLNPLFVPDFKDWDANPVRVVSTHMSKSVTLPVYSIAVTDKVTITMRYNFHNWIVSVESTSPVPDNFYGLFNEDEKQEPVYCEGFVAARVFPPYKHSRLAFTLKLGSRFDLYTFCFLLREGLRLPGSSQA